MQHLKWELFVAGTCCLPQRRQTKLAGSRAESIHIQYPRPWELSFQFSPFAIFWPQVEVLTAPLCLHCLWFLGKMLKSFQAFLSTATALGNPGKHEKGCAPPPSALHSHLPVPGDHRRQQGICRFNQHSQGTAQILNVPTPRHPVPQYLQLPIHHACSPLSEQRTGLTSQVFATALTIGWTQKKLSGIIWKTRKQLPGLNGSILLPALCRLKRALPLTYVQLAVL